MRVDCFVAMGDSFTAGTGERPWTEDVTRALRAEHPGCRFHNLAAVGATSGEVAESQLPRAIELRPDLVSLICGANDVVLSVRPDVEAFATAFAAMLDRLRQELPGAAVVTATYPDVSRFFPLRPRTRARVSRGITEVNEAIRSLARDRGTLCLEFAGHPEQDLRGNFADDGFHPSRDGHRKAARAFLLGLRDQAPDLLEVK